MRRLHLVSLPLVAALLGAAPAAALAPPHDASNGIGCLDCHSAHDASMALKPRDHDQEAVCASCHNPTGQAATLADVALHVVGDATRIVDCGSCHDAHGPQITTDAAHGGGATAPNLRLVRGDPGKYVPGAAAPMLFQSRPGHFAFPTGAAPYNGVCQSCHQDTAHHRRDASGDHDHYVGQSCVQCHPHKSGFLPTSCVGCHNAPQDNGDGLPPGGRRAVLGEFSTTTSHAHLGQLPVSDADCLVCHDVTGHQSGTIVLLDPDDATPLSFVTVDELTGDPDVSDFCMHCHDADGATRLPSPMDPFGNGDAPPDIARRFQGTLAWYEWYGDSCFGSEGTMRFVNSHHDIADGDQQRSGAKLECLSCHGAHNAARDQKLADPDDTTQPWIGSVSGFCLRCHAGGHSPTAPDMPPGVRTATILVDAAGQPCDGPYDDGCATPLEVSGLRPLDSCDYFGPPWHVEYTNTHSPHGLDSKRDWTGYSGAPGAELECTVCHDAHGSVSASNLAGNPYLIRDWVDGLPFVDDGVRPGAQWLGPPWNTTGQSREVVVTVTPGATPPPTGSSPAVVDWGGPTGLCSTCHSNWEAAYSWHSFCGSCQSCHGHGQVWGNNDWGSSSSDTSCGDCGNGVLNGHEECDDGNRVDGDGCSNECRIE